MFIEKARKDPSRVFRNRALLPVGSASGRQSKGSATERQGTTCQAQKSFMPGSSGKRLPFHSCPEKAETWDRFCGSKLEPFLEP